MKDFFMGLLKFIFFIGLLYAAVYLTGHNDDLIQMLKNVTEMAYSAIISIKSMINK